MTPATHMKDDAIAREVANLVARWRSMDREGGGSPGEWLTERLNELETEQERRAKGGALQTETPMQSR